MAPSADIGEIKAQLDVVVSTTARIEGEATALESSHGDPNASKLELRAASDVCTQAAVVLKTIKEGLERDALLRVWRKQVLLINSLNKRLDLIVVHPVKLAAKDVPEDDNVKSSPSAHHPAPQQSFMDPSIAHINGVSDVEMSNLQMKQIEADVKDLAEIFVDLRHVVDNQGTIYDELERSTKLAAENAQKTKDLIADTERRTARRPAYQIVLLCLLCAIVVCVILYFAVYRRYY